MKTYGGYYRIWRHLVGTIEYGHIWEVLKNMKTSGG